MMRIRGRLLFLDVQCVSRTRYLLWLACCFLSLEGCSPPGPSGNPGTAKPNETDAFKSYWYAGKAEISSYRLDQSRYGETRDGKAVLIFVMEDISKKRQVKLEDASTAGEDKVNVLKMNFTKNFVTGIYPYSMMLSVFTPVNRKEFPHTLKVTMSSQEWCGQVFSQMNLTGRDYSFVGHSYFQKEGEERFSVMAPWLEDELWNMIRLDPGGLPVGDAEIIPGLFFTRLNHTPPKPMKAFITKTESGDTICYSVSFPKQQRGLVIFFRKEFPHKILSWDETFAEHGQTFRTSAILDKSVLIDYWKKNKNEFQYLRDSLGLSRHNF